jgi:predicted ribosomally synthesized peptide with nif11-like leader
MSKKAAVEYWTKVWDDADLSKEMEESLASRTPAEKAEYIIRAGARAGFTFTADELADAEEALRERLDGQLDDEDLEAVAGGAGLIAPLVPRPLYGVMPLYGVVPLYGIAT